MSLHRHKMQFGRDIPYEDNLNNFCCDNSESESSGYDSPTYHFESSSDSHSDVDASSCTDSDHDSSSSDEDTSLTQKDIVEFSKEMWEQYSRGAISGVALESTLQIFHKILEKANVGPAFSRHKIPQSMFLCEKWAKSDTLPPTSVLLDICPEKDHYVFPEGSAETSCPVCNRARDSERQMMVGGIDKQLQDMYRVPFIAQVL